MKITKGKVKKPVKCVICGVEGIGKTTLAAQFPDPLFIDVEDGSSQLDVARTEIPRSWDKLLDLVREVIAEKPCKTLVIDTADWAEKLCTQDLLAKHHADGIESLGGGYGKGWTYLQESFQRLLAGLNKVVESGMNAVLIAHVAMKKVELPEEQGAYDKWEMKLSKKVAPIVKEWADMVLFCNYKIMVVENSKTHTKKATGGQRVMYATHNPVWDAKNRFGLPDEMPLDFKQIEHIFTGDVNDPIKVVQDIKQEADRKEIVQEAQGEEWVPSRDSKEDALKILDEYMAHFKIKESQIRQLVGSKGWYPYGTPISDYQTEFIWDMLIDQWDRVKGMVEPEEDIDIEI